MNEKFCYLWNEWMNCPKHNGSEEVKLRIGDKEGIFGLPFWINEIILFFASSYELDIKNSLTTPFMFSSEFSK